jgi:hypothetical protein
MSLEGGYLRCELVEDLRRYMVWLSLVLVRSEIYLRLWCKRKGVVLLLIGVCCCCLAFLHTQCVLKSKIWRAFNCSFRPASACFWYFKIIHEKPLGLESWVFCRNGVFQAQDGWLNKDLCGKIKYNSIRNPPPLLLSFLLPFALRFINSLPYQLC